MTDPVLYATIAVSGLIAIAILAFAGLKGLNGWLEFKRAELGAGHEPSSPSPIARIEMADLKERLRKLEAIAAGVDL